MKHVNKFEDYDNINEEFDINQNFDGQKAELLDKLDEFMMDYNIFAVRISSKDTTKCADHFIQLRKMKKDIIEFSEVPYKKTNEGKLERGFAKTAVNVAAFIIKFKSLFNKTDRTKFFKTMKESNKMIDLISYLRDSQNWLDDDNLDQKDIEILAKNLGIDKTSPTVWDIFEARYELEFKRDLKDDLDVIIEALSSEYKGKDPSTLASFKDIKEMAIDLKKLIE
jgi:hypothetical protein